MFGRGGHAPWCAGRMTREEFEAWDRAEGQYLLEEGWKFIRAYRAKHGTPPPTTVCDPSPSPNAD